MLRGFFITICLVAASPSVAQQVRVITGDIEHVYGPGGQVLDDAKLREKNRRAERQMQEQGANADFDQRQSFQTRRGSWNVQSWGSENSSQQPPQSWWNVENSHRQVPQSWWSVDNNRSQAPKSAWAGQQPPDSQWATSNNRQQLPRSQWADPNNRRQPPMSAWSPR
jgi:hypothetical protein